MGAVRIVVVNSDPAARERILALLAAAQFEAVAAATARDALTLLGSGPCDALVVEHVLEDMTGLELLSACRAAGFEPVAVMTAARGEVRTAVRAVREGVSDFLPAPHDARIVQALRRVLARHQA